MRIWPRSLAGQMALLIALALFAAQAINFALILRDRAEFRLAQATRPVATRIADALEREARGGRALEPDRGRVRRVAANPVPPDAGHHPEVVAELRRQLTELGVGVGRIETGLAPASDPAGEDGVGRRRPVRIRDGRPIDTLLIAVEQPGHGWLAIVSPWPRAGARLLWSLIGQTLILYAVVLVPVLFIVQRLSAPLRDLRQAAERFGPGDPGEPLPARGPEDVTALIAAFNALRRRVVGMLDDKDRMLGAIGHDLRTPLAALRVRVESVEDDADRARMIETIADMSRTLEDILSLARLGRPSEPLTDVDLAALVDAVVDDFRDLDLPVTLQESGRVRAHLRPALMRRAVRNLIENAIKYGEKADVRLLTSVGSVAIEVADQGPGIPDGRLRDVFDPFTRLENSRNRETGGIGLGLALAEAIVRDAGGAVTLANRIEGGLTATITLPR